MKNKFKKSMLALGTIATVVAPIATVVSCGGDATGTGKAYLDQVNDGKIKIMTSFSKGGQQERAFQAQIDAYNATKPEMRVEISRIEGGYGAEASTLTTKIEGKDTKTLPNLVVGYGDTLGTLAKYDMQMNLEDSSSKVLRNKFEDKFMSENDNIGGLDGSKGTFLVPLAKSTEVNNVNTEVIGYILNAMKADGATITGNKTKEIMDKAADSSSDADQAYIKELWKDITPKSASSLKLDDSIFETFSGMINFATVAQDAFAETIKNKELHVLGIDAPTNLLYEMAYAELGNKDLGDAHSFLFNKGSDGYLEHPWRDSKTVEGKALKAVYESITKGLENGAIMMNGGGAYSSQTEVQHKVGMAIGSTAGYSHNYVKGASTTFKFKTTDAKTGKEVTLTMDHTDVYKDDGGTFKFSSYGNQILLAPTETSTNTHDIKITDPAIIAKITALRAAATAGTVKLAVSSNANASKVKDAIQLTKGSYPKYLISSSDTNLVVEEITTAKTLNKDELKLLQAPTTKEGKTSESIFSQGPSLIGVHANDAEDEGTRLFVKWLTSENKPGTSLDEQAAAAAGELAKTPLAQFTIEAGYIGVLKGSFDKAAPSAFSPAQALAYTGFQDAVKTKGYRILTNPIDDTTSKIRDSIEVALRAEYNIRAEANSGAASTIDSLTTFYGKLKA